jgi:tripartite ATP-independent transporter DctM subunit
MELWMVLTMVAVLLVLRVPVALAFFGPSILYFLIGGSQVGYVLTTAMAGVNSFPLLAVPLFIFVGVLANRLGIAERLFAFAQASLARVPGNLAYVNVATSLGFSWMSGSALADSAGLGKLQIPAMMKAGYPFRFAAGLTASSALISPVMPPSIPAVIFASVAAVSTGALFAAAVIPAFLMGLALTVYVAIWVARQPNMQSQPFSARLLSKTGLRVLGPALTPVIILGGIIGGVFTPTEAAAVASVYMLLLGVLYRTLTATVLWEAIKETILITASIMIILGAAAVLGLILARERVSENIGNFLLATTDNPLVFLLLLNIVLLLIGMVVDPTAVILVLVPVFLPIAVEYGIDPLHFGVVVIMNLMVGLLTPPVGSVLYVMASISNQSVEEMFRGILPFLIPLFSVVLLVTIFPAISTFLPSLLG